MSGTSGVTSTTLATGGAPTPPDDLWSEVVRAAPVIAATATVVALIFAILTFVITRRKDRREQQADRLEDPNVQQRAIADTESYLQFLRDVLWSIVQDLNAIIDLRAPFDPQGRYALVVDASLFPLPQQHDRHHRLLADLLSHGEEAAGYAAAIRQRLRTLVKAGWRLKPEDVAAPLTRVEYLTQRLAVPESTHPSDAFQFAMEAHDAVAAIVKAGPVLPP